MDNDRPRVLSFGGGVQSSALLALLGQGRYPGAEPQEVWFCDPMHERPETYTWIADTIRPYLAALDVPFVRLERHVSPSRGPDLLEAYRRRDAFPLRSNRVCTIEWKVNVMVREARRRGWDKGPGVEKHIGISLDELPRARSGGELPWESKRYPLIEARLLRDDCVRLCEQTWGCVPAKSGCRFCKYMRPQQWREVWEQRADGYWDQLVAWEHEVVARRGKSCVFVDARPQRTLTAWARSWELGEQMPLPDAQSEEVACEGGYCMV